MNRHALKDGLIIFDNGDKYWLKNGKPHREDGPAIEKGNGSKLWCKNGKLHREDGPAFEWDDEIKIWFLNGKQFPKFIFYIKVNIFDKFFNYMKRGICND